MTFSLAVAVLFCLLLPHSVQIQFDNRGSKVMSADANKKITAALAKYVFMVPPGNVQKATGMGQSSLVNHQVRQTTTVAVTAAAVGWQCCLQAKHAK